MLLFAGTFDPITSGHILMLRQCVDCDFFDQIWMLPSGKRTDKTFNVPDDDRVKLCSLALQEFTGRLKRVKICDYEVRKGVTIDTYFTVRYFQEKYPEYDFYFFIGSDILPQLFNWPYAEQLVEITNFLIALREGYEIHEEDLAKLKQYVLLSTLLELNNRTMVTSPTSSTLVRQQLFEGIDCCDEGTLHPAVMGFISENSLYKSKIKASDGDM